MNRFGIISTHAQWSRTLVIAGWLACTGGCSLFKSSAKDERLGATLTGSPEAQAYQRIRQAKSQNSLVLQVAGDSMPVRILPLPSDGTPVYVSNLLKQTGIQDKMGRIIVGVYRSSENGYDEVKMAVRFDDSGETIRPETDYVLRPGDRIKISKDPTTSFGSLIDQFVPTNASRAIAGR